MLGQSVLFQAFYFYAVIQMHVECSHCCLRKYKNTLPLMFHNVPPKNGPFSLLTMKGLEGKHAVRHEILKTTS